MCFKKKSFKLVRIVLSNNGGGARKNIYFANKILEEAGVKTTTFIKKPKESDQYTSSDKVPFDYKHNFAGLLPLLVKNKSDKNLLFTLHLKNAIIIFGLIFYILKIPYSCVIHQDIETITWRSKYTNKIYFFLLKKSKINISISNFIADRLKYYGINSQVLINASEKLQVAKKNKVIKKVGIVGELTPRKGVLEADIIARDLGDKFDVRIYGKGKLEREVAKFTYASYKGYQSLQTILEEVDILLFLSYNEPFGRIITEFMSASLPVLVRNSGEPPNIINDIRQTFDKNSCIKVKLKAIQENYDSITCSNALNFEQNFTFDIYRNRLIKIYNQYFFEKNIIES